MKKTNENNLLLSLSEKGVLIVKFDDDNKYKIWEVPFYNELIIKFEFNIYFDEFIIRQ
ncbi:hypothetical protein N8G13_02075 [Mycoplasma zalophi]|uniref:DUF2442 domain-containing protein n=1 Tax=Mycoplasma zalophi TaxID=191287 RepID=A0ABS6DR86_9MOLU|nr:hypothetical protein [Mycoplasma zalophi]MBU4692291.1 hypothetical protein [Mycoplasma zalophi]MCU4117242.1 hypothetical protein [Mycoplasma zalophi]